MAKLAQAPLAVIGDGTQRLEEIRETVANLPAEYRAIFARTLRAMAEELSPDTSTRSVETAAQELSAESSVQQMDRFFRARSNKPATIAEISKGTGIPLMSVRTHIYNRHRIRFDKVAARAGKATLWRWAELVPLQEQGKNGADLKKGRSG
jgi:hypothetical protein